MGTTSYGLRLNLAGHSFGVKTSFYQYCTSLLPHGKLTGSNIDFRFRATTPVLTVISPEVYVVV